MSSKGKVWESFASLQRAIVEARLTITIDNEYCFNTCEDFPFYAGEKNEFKWLLSLKVWNGYLYTELALKEAPEHGADQLVMYEIVLLNEQKKQSWIKNCPLTFTLSSNGKEYNRLYVEVCEINEIVKRSPNLLPGVKSTISVKLITFDRCVQQLKPARKCLMPPHMAREKLFDDHKNLYETKDFSDIILAAGSREISAHRSILAARSPVFKAMFSHSFEEVKSNRVEIPDIDPDVLEEVIRFIYTAEYPRIEEMPMELLAAADKYDIESLRMLCGEVLLRQLESHNAIDLLLLADRHSATELKEKAIRLIKLKKILNKETIERLPPKNSSLLREILLQEN